MPIICKSKCIGRAYSNKREGLDVAEIKNSILELVGSTPLVRLHGLEGEERAVADVLAKIEYRNPSRSIADRFVPELIRIAEERGLLQEGKTIIEAAEGNIGVSLAQVAAVKGYPLTLVLPASANREYRKLIGGFGAKVIVTPRQQGLEGAKQKAQELLEQTPDSVTLLQDLTIENAGIHYRTIGPEIWESAGGRIDIFVAEEGSDGVLAGVGKYLKEQQPRTKVVAVRLQGSAARGDDYDEIVMVGKNEAYQTTSELAKKEGILAGISSGAAVYAALQIAKRKENKGKRIVVLLSDTGERYLSTEVFGAVLAPPDPF